MSHDSKSAPEPAHQTPQPPAPHTGPILVPVDFSECAAEVVAEAIAIALNTGASLELLHAVDLGDMDPETQIQPDGDASTQTTAADLLEAEAHASLTKLAGPAKAAKVEVTTSVIHGAAVDVIIGQAEASSAPMIVMGTHGRRGLSRWILGSVAEKVIRRANIPVVTHRTEHKPHCEPNNCGWCGSHITPAARRVRAELGG